jgi:hypothetical protein
MHHQPKFSITALACGTALALVPNLAWAYNEAVSGDLSDVAASPTVLAFGVGNNQVKGTMVTPPPPAENDTRDFITFTVPPGHQLTAIILEEYIALPGGGPGNTGFHAINAGPVGKTPGVDPSSAFLGGDHVSGANEGMNILLDLAITPLSGTGFSVPLPAGTYSYVIQQTGNDLTGYDLNFVIAAVPPVPGTTPVWLGAGAVALLALGALAMARTQHRDPGVA